MNDEKQSNLTALSADLNRNLATMRRLMGDRWESASKEYREILTAAMVGSGDSNPIACAIPLAKEAQFQGAVPLMFLAVATEMSEEKR